MRDSLTLASICMCSSSDKEKNIATAVRLVTAAAEAGADWVLLPEMFTTLGGSYKQAFSQAEVEDGPLNHKLAELAQRLGISLIAGSLGERPSREEQEALACPDLADQQVFNTLYMFSPRGERIAKYRKCHLFTLKDQEGKTLYSEQEGFLAGDRLKVIDYEGWRLGFAICYDLRFPSFFQKMIAASPIDMLIVPAAFTQATGKCHWQLLLQARAIELQAFVFSANQTGVHGPGKESYGHGMIVDPWGEILANTGPKEGFALAKVTKATLAAYRQRLPVLANRRHHLYEI